LTNEELYQRFGEKAVRSISKMSGINERRVTSDGETAADLATRAAQQLLAEQDCDPQSIDLLLFTSQTPDYTRFRPQLASCTNAWDFVRTAPASTSIRAAVRFRTV
jgi:3-oxoacyl-[acyl-carrier-protein] synthase III